MFKGYQPRRELVRAHNLTWNIHNGPLLLMQAEDSIRNLSLTENWEKKMSLQMRWTGLPKQDSGSYVSGLNATFKGAILLQFLTLIWDAENNIINILHFARNLLCSDMWNQNFLLDFSHIEINGINFIIFTLTITKAGTKKSVSKNGENI